MALKTIEIVHWVANIKSLHYDRKQLSNIGIDIRKPYKTTMLRVNYIEWFSKLKILHPHYKFHTHVSYHNSSIIRFYWVQTNAQGNHLLEAIFLKPSSWRMKQFDDYISGALCWTQVWCRASQALLAATKIRKMKFRDTFIHLSSHGR